MGKELLSVGDQRICILSSCNHIRTLAHINHSYYAEQHGYVYVFDISPVAEEYFCQSKIKRILNFLPHFDYVFWIDDDAFFTNFDQPISALLSGDSHADIIVCKSPVNRGRWTYINAGVMLIKNTDKSIRFLEKVVSADVKSISDNWDTSEFGIFTNGDQDVLIYLMQGDPVTIKRMPPESFNSRSFQYDFDKPVSQKFVVHFTDANKQKQAAQFANAFDLNSALVPNDYFRSIQPYFYSEKIFPVTLHKRILALFKRCLRSITR